MVCKFCREDKQLISSHIIPKSFYQIEDEKFGLKIITEREGEFPKRSRTGVYDKNILCKECDSYFGKLDEYAAEYFLRASSVAELRDTSGPIARSYKDIDQKKIFDFVLSVLLRAAWSSELFFQKVELGPYLESIERYFKTGEKLTDAIDIIVAEYDERAPLLDPHRTRFDGANYWCLYANRFIFYIKVDRKKLLPDFSGISILTAPSLVTIVRQWRGSKERDVMQKLARNVNKKYPSLHRHQKNK